MSSVGICSSGSGELCQKEEKERRKQSPKSSIASVKPADCVLLVCVRVRNLICEQHACANGPKCQLPSSYSQSQSQSLSLRLLCGRTQFVAAFNCVQLSHSPFTVGPKLHWASRPSVALPLAPRRQSHAHMAHRQHQMGAHFSPSLRASFPTCCTPEATFSPNWPPISVYRCELFLFLAANSVWISFQFAAARKSATCSVCFDNNTCRQSSAFSGRLVQLAHH